MQYPIKQTDSVYTVGEVRKTKLNLLDLVQSTQSKRKNDAIQTFDEFKQAINSFDFENNQQHQVRTSRMRMAKYSLPAEYSDILNTNSNFQTRRVQTLDIPSLPSFGGGQTRQSYLEIVKEELKSRASSKRLKMEEQMNLQTGLDLTYKLQQSDLYDAQRIHRRDSFGERRERKQSEKATTFSGQQIDWYQVKEKLGKGGFSTVYLCVDCRSNKQYAMKTVQRKSMRKKIFRKNSLALTDNFINNEIAILKKMEHPYIIKLHDVIQSVDQSKIYMILDYCEGGFINQIRPLQNTNKQKLKDSGLKQNSKDLMKDSNGQKESMKSSGIKESMIDSRKSQKSPTYKKLLESECKRYYKQLCLAIDYIHNVAKIAHRDIKPQNILISQKDIKVSDFGLGTEDIQVLSKSGTINYLAPEVRAKPNNSITNSKVNAQKSDIWAMGITLLVLLKGKLVQIPDEDLQDAKMQKYVDDVKGISVQCRDFLKKCLKIQPEMRMSARQTLDHAWIDVKKVQEYPQITVTPEQQQLAIKKQNKQILTQLVRQFLPTVHQQKQEQKIVSQINQ